MGKNLKFLFLASLVLFAAFINIAKADDDDLEDGEDEDDENERDYGLGEVEDREVGEVEGKGFRAIRVDRVTANGTETIAFTFRAFPVPRIRVRYFDVKVEDSQLEDNDLDEKIDIVATIPGFFFYTEADGVAGFDVSTDNITRTVNLRRANGNAWAIPELQTEVVDAVKVFKVTTCRKINDFCFVAYVANGTTTFDGFALTADSVKFNVEINPAATAFVVAENERLAIVVKVHFKDGFEVEDNSEENEELEKTGAAVTQNDVLIGTSEFSAYFNWEKTVTVTYSDNSTAELNLISTVVDDLPFDRKVESPGTTEDEVDEVDEEDEEDFSELEETEEERETEDEDETYSEDEEDDAVKYKLDSERRVFVFAVDGSLSNAVKIVWDPNTGPSDLPVTAASTGTTATTGETGAAGAVPVTFVKILVAAAAFVALLL